MAAYLAAQIAFDFQEWIRDREAALARDTGGPRSGVSGWSLASPMCRAHLVGTPCEREAPQEPVEVGVAFWQRMDRGPRGEGGEMMLNGPNLVQQRERVPRTEHRAVPVLSIVAYTNAGESTPAASPRPH